jgi:hypothetical protein
MRCLAFLFSIALLLTACTALSTTTIDELATRGDDARGIEYALPLGLVSVAVTVVPSTAVFTLTLGAPKFVADPKHRYLLQYRPLPNYADKISVSMQPGSPFFKQVKADTTDQTAEIIVALLGKTYPISYEAGSDEIPLGTQSIDLSDPEQVKRAVLALNKAVVGFARAQSECPPPSQAAPPQPKTTSPGPATSAVKTQAAAGKAAPGNASKGTGAAGPPAGKGSSPGVISPGAPAPEAPPPGGTATPLPAPDPVSSQPQSGLKPCVVYKDIADRGENWLAGAAGAEPIVALYVKMPQPIPSAGPADCGEGICYRPKEPYLVRYMIDGVVGSTIIYLPNHASLVSIDIRRAFFINKVQTIDFNADGSLNKLSINKESELLAISKLPVDVISAITDALRLRVKVLSAETQTVKNQTDLLKAQQQLAAAEKAASTKPKEVAGKATSLPPNVLTGLAAQGVRRPD